MATTDAQINAAVPPAGTPNRASTNAVLKAIRDSAELGENTASVVRRFTPVEGGTVSVASGRRNVVAILEGGANLAALTIQLPTGADEREGQIVRVVSLIEVDSISYNGSEAWGAPNHLFVNDGFTLFNIGFNEWILVK